MAHTDEPDYVFRDRHPERHDVYALYDSESERTRRELSCVLDLPYGPHPRMMFDLFPGARKAPLVIFFHGGYWQSLDKHRFSFVAGSLVARGFSVALPNYPLAPETRPEQIASAARSSLPVILDAVARHTGTPSCWLTAGHSAGGHLAVWAGMTASSSTVAASVPFAGMVPISGIFDLRPLVGTSLNTALGLTVRRAAKLSPIECTLPKVPYRVVVGEDETKGFLDQATLFTRALEAQGCEADCAQLPGLNHYTILKDLLSSHSIVVKMIEQMAGIGRDRANR